MMAKAILKKVSYRRGRRIEAIKKSPLLLRRLLPDHANQVDQMDLGPTNPRQGSFSIGVFYRISIDFFSYLWILLLDLLGKSCCLKAGEDTPDNPTYTRPLESRTYTSNPFILPPATNIFSKDRHDSSNAKRRERRAKSGRETRMKVFTLVFTDTWGTQKSVLDFLDTRREILNWYSYFPHNIFIVSNYTAHKLSQIFISKYPNTFFLISEIAGTTTNGWLLKEGWDFINNPKSSGHWG